MGDHVVIGAGGFDAGDDDAIEIARRDFMRVYNFDDGGIFGESEIGESCAVHTDDDFGVIEEVNLLL